MSGRPVHQKLNSYQRALTHVALAACVLIVARPAEAQQARVLVQLSAIAADSTFRFESNPSFGVVVGQYGVDARGFVVSDSNARGITSLIALRKADPTLAYRIIFAEPDGKEYPFALALPAGRYYFVHSGTEPNLHMRAFRITTNVKSPKATTARAWFDVDSGVVTCIGRVALELELMLTGPREASAVPRGIGVNDNCERIVAAFRSRRGAVQDSVSTRLAVVSP